MLMNLELHISISIQFSHSLHFISYITSSSPIAYPGEKRHADHAFKLYKTLLQHFEGIEKPFMLFLFVRIFNGFFMSLYALLYAVRVRNEPIPNMSFVDFFTHTTLMRIVVLSADHAQRKADQFRISLTNIVKSIPQWKGSTIDSLKIQVFEVDGLGGFFMSLYALLYAVRVGNVPIPNMSFVDFFTHATLMRIVVLSADHAQRRLMNIAYEYRQVNSLMEGSAIDSLRIRSI
ncbi:hypothetical protein CEXT_207171 [Caerostris extrusa]|uniref:Uncharacterized protein n=1 Tax=Caerostris extrusa TaxID=172846 RepID=A0AAV4VIK7_CAEEX|nr:hypothetical protein CEXT_207171 [Caerostris extrusa]